MSDLRILIGLLVVLSGCGITKYPGQPGVFTNSFARIDFESLASTGLYTHEVTYDNREGGKGVGAIVTKFYPGALTYTSNARTNADGTLYRTKTQYNGAKVEMISIPQQNQILMPPDSTIAIFAEYELSLDEIDDVNVAEQDLFVPPITKLKRLAKQFFEYRLEWLRAGKAGEGSVLNYKFVKLHLGEKSFQPSEATTATTNLAQNSVRVRVSPAVLSEFQSFLEAEFPQGFKGVVKLETSEGKQLKLPLGLHTRKTAESSGITFVETRNLEAILKKYQ